MTYFGEPRLGFLFKGNLVQRDVIELIQGFTRVLSAAEREFNAIRGKREFEAEKRE